MSCYYVHMIISSAKFIKGIVGDDQLLEEDVLKVAFVGRSNVGKSSLINALTNSSVARTSGSAGSTQEINVYLINKNIYFFDLPGYGFARKSGRGKEKIGDLIDFYLFQKAHSHEKIVLVIDIQTGMTDKDLSMFEELKDYGKDMIIAVSKIDKLNQSEIHHKLQAIKAHTGEYTVIPFSSKKKTRINTLIETLLK